MLLEDANVDPVAVVPALQHAWRQRRVTNNVRKAADCPAENPMMLTIRLTAVSGPWRGDPVSAMPWITIDPRIDERARAKHRQHGFKDESDNVVMLINRNEPGWVATTNLTAALSTLKAALHEEAH